MITLHTIVFVVRFANLKDAAVRVCDDEMIYQLEQDNLLNNVRHNVAFLTNIY